MTLIKMDTSPKRMCDLSCHMSLLSTISKLNKLARGPSKEKEVESKYQFCHLVLILISSFSSTYIDRSETQEEIQLLIETVFGDKKRINYDEYMKIQQDVTSEMFLSLLTLL